VRFNPTEWVRNHESTGSSRNSSRNQSPADRGRRRTPSPATRPPRKGPSSRERIRSPRDVEVIRQLINQRYQY
jgi:hypothetical protein